MSNGIGGLLRHSNFWWTLVVLNGVLASVQPLAILASAALVLVLFACKVVLDSLPGDFGETVSRIAARVILWGLGYVFILAAFSLIAPKLLGGRRFYAVVQSEVFPFVGVFGPIALLVGLRFLWLWWKRPKPRPVAVPVVLKPPLPVAPDPSQERERREREAKAAGDQKRREDARGRVELFFNVNAPELQNRFTRDMLTDYVTRYMGDERPAELVEERGETLMGVIRQHLDKAVPKGNAQTLDDVLATFEVRMRKIRESGLEDEDKQHLLIQLADQREAAVTKAIQEGRV